ncbi:MAG: hypothetical protein PVH46_01410 [Granulosicoccaceae bacterium]|jgi:intracellular sulfur oxidation DsrE/DsrF family protein
MREQFLALSMALFLMSPSWADSDVEDIQQILSRDKAPVGVVFEIASTDKDFLTRVLPVISNHASHLRRRFPDIKLAIVSHGLEQFSLTKDEAGQGIQKKVARLVREHDIPLHVCATFASAHGVDRDAFIAVVNVVQAAATRVDRYEDEGYERVFLEPAEC